MSSPTQRSLAECRKRGYTAQVVEKWNSHAKVRVDLFGVIDIVAITPPTPGDRDACHCEAWNESECACGGYQAMMSDSGRILAIQACAGSSHSARLAKILAEPRAKQWVEAGGLLELWSWSKRGARGKAKRWALRVDAVTVERFCAPSSDSAAPQTQTTYTNNPDASGKAAA
jgi:hypothetical protein